MSELGTNIAAKRMKCGLNQMELAERVGRSPTAILYIERNQRRPSVELLANIAKALDCSVDELLGNESGASS